jgi:hypothetical protein
MVIRFERLPRYEEMSGIYHTFCDLLLEEDFEFNSLEEALENLGSEGMALNWWGFGVGERYEDGGTEVLVGHHGRKYHEVPVLLARVS